MAIANYKEKQKRGMRQVFSCKMCNKPFEADTVTLFNVAGAAVEKKNFMRCTGGQEAQCGECAIRYGGLGEQAGRERAARLGH